MDTSPTHTASLYYVNPADSTEMVLIPGGWFQMGSGDEDPNAYSSEKPRHLHHVAPFYLGITCVTQAQFKTFVKETGYSGGRYPGTGDKGDGRWGKWKNDPPGHPVRFINWHDARAYCRWAKNFFWHVLSPLLTKPFTISCGLFLFDMQG